MGDVAVDELDDLMARLPVQSGADLFAEMEQARRAAETAPPPPQYPYALEYVRRGKAWFKCQQPGCRWGVEVDHDPGNLPPLVVPADYTSADISAAISTMAQARSEALRKRLDDDFRGHLGEVHQDEPAGTAH